MSNNEETTKKNGFLLFFFKNSRFSILLILMILIGGIFSIINIPKESAPEVEIPVGIVTTVLPGSSPLEVETFITDEIEDAVINLNGVDSVTSTSREGISNVVVEFSAQSNLSESIRELREEVDSISSSLPQAAEDPQVSEVSFVDQPILIASLSGEVPPEAFVSVANTLESEIEKIEGVRRVSVGGLQSKQVRVNLDPASLAQFNISASQVEQSIRQADISVPTGSVFFDSATYAVRLEGRIDSIEEISNIPLTSYGDTVIFVGDVASVFETIAPASTTTRVSLTGEPAIPAISFSVFKKPGGDITEITGNVRERIAELEQDELQGFNTVITYDTGELISNDLSSLSITGLQTVILVFLVLLLVFGWQSALVASLAIPLSFLLAFVGLLLSGNTINFVSLFSLILAIGILVDSAVVVVEGISANREVGMDMHKAVSVALSEYSLPLTAGTMTTIAVFLPLFFISGITGEFIASIPFTILFVLLASLIIALAFIPLLSKLIIRKNPQKSERKVQSWIEELKGKYKTTLSNLLDNSKRKRWLVGVVIALFFLSFALPILGLVQTIFFPQEDADFIYADIELAPATRLEETAQEVERFEDILYDKEYIESFITTIGSGSDFSGDFSSAGGQTENRANITINLKDSRQKSSDEILSELQDSAASIISYSVTLSQPAGGPPVGSPVVIKYFGSEFSDLQTASNRTIDILESIEGVENISSSLETQPLELKINIDRDVATLYGISPIQVAQDLRTSLQGSTALEYREGEDKIDVVVQTNFTGQNGNSLRSLNNITVNELEQYRLYTAGGEVNLGTIAEISLGASPASINHEGGRRIVNVTADVSGTTPQSAISEVIDQYPIDELPDNTDRSTGGETEESQQAFQEMALALVAGILLMIVILVLQFNSFRQTAFILLTVPLALTGILFGLTVTGKTLSFPSMMGFIALAGIIVNNAIILIDQMNRTRDIAHKTEAVIEAAGSRLRPIMLTSITTIIGLIPLTYASALWSPLAWAIIFGLLYASVLTLFVIPVIYHRFG